MKYPAGTQAVDHETFSPVRLSCMACITFIEVLPFILGKPRGVREKMMDRHPLPGCRALGVVLADRILDTQLSIVRKLQDCSCSELLAQGCDLECCLRRVWDLPFLNCRTITFLDEHVTGTLNQNSARKCLAGPRLLIRKSRRGKAGLHVWHGSTGAERPPSLL